MKNSPELDTESQDSLTRMAEQERILGNRVPGVKIVLVVLSSSGVVYDAEALRQKIHFAYPDAAVFFVTTDGKALGASAPRQVDLLIDFTGPGQRQGLFYSKRLRRRARFAVGRNAGLFRKKIYDRVFDEKAQKKLPDAILPRERLVQREVLALAGVALVQSGDSAPDRGKITPLELPPMQRL